MKEKSELELLQTSFDLGDSPHQMNLASLASSFDSEVGDNDEIVFDESDMRQDKERKEIIKNALNNYIAERLQAVSQEYAHS